MEAAASGRIEAWERVVAAFNERGDLAPFWDLMADDSTMDVGTKRALSGAELRDRVRALQDAGWVKYELIGSSTAGALVLNVSRNVMRDGSSFLVGAVLRFNDEGRIAEVRQMRSD